LEKGQENGVEKGKGIGTGWKGEPLILLWGVFEKGGRGTFRSFKEVQGYHSRRMSQGKGYFWCQRLRVLV